MSGCALLMSAEIRCSQPGLYLFREILPSMQRRLASVQIFGRTRPPSLNILRMLCFQIVTFESGRDAASIGIRGFLNRLLIMSRRSCLNVLRSILSSFWATGSSPATEEYQTNGGGNDRVGFESFRELKSHSPLNSLEFARPWTGRCAPTATSAVQTRFRIDGFRVRGCLMVRERQFGRRDQVEITIHFHCQDARHT